MKKLNLTLIGLFCLLNIQAQTVDVITSIDQPLDLVFDGNILYFSDANSVKKVDVSVAVPVAETLMTGLDVGAGLILKDEMIYVTDFYIGRIWKIDISTNIPVSEVFIEGIGNPNMLAINNDILYYTDNAQQIIGQIDLNDPNPESTIFLSDAGNVIGIEVYQDEMYYSTVGYNATGINKVDLTIPNPVPEVLYTSADWPLGLNACGSDFYISDRDANMILKFNRSCGPMELENVVLDMEEPRQTAIHDGFIYVAEQGEYYLGKISKTPIVDLTCGVDVQVACNSFTWQDGITYTSSTNSPTIVLTNSEGCDSLVTLNLTLVDTLSYSTDVQVACNEFTWIDGNTYTENNDTATFVYTNGECDSIVTLDLTINQVDIEVLLTGNDTLTAAANGMSYQWLDCNNNFAPINGEVNQVFVASVEGAYAVEITQNDCVVISDCVDVMLTDIDELDLFTTVNIYPNPTEGAVEIDFGNLSNPNVEVYSSIGKLLFEHKTIVGRKLNFQLNEASGVYFVKVRVGEASRVYRVVKI